MCFIPSVMIQAQELWFCLHTAVQLNGCPLRSMMYFTTDVDTCSDCLQLLAESLYPERVLGGITLVSELLICTSITLVQNMNSSSFAKAGNIIQMIKNLLCVHRQSRGFWPMKKLHDWRSIAAVCSDLNRLNSHRLVSSTLFTDPNTPPPACDVMWHIAVWVKLCVYKCLLLLLKNLQVSLPLDPQVSPYSVVIQRTHLLTAVSELDSVFVHSIVFDSSLRTSQIRFQFTVFYRVY